jgi:hypothetical protein
VTGGECLRAAHIEKQEINGTLFHGFMHVPAIGFQGEKALEMKHSNG